MRPRGSPGVRGRSRRFGDSVYVASFAFPSAKRRSTSSWSCGTPAVRTRTVVSDRYAKHAFHGERLPSSRALARSWSCSGV